MEPFRSLVDRRVVQWIADHDPAAEIDSATKNWIIGTTTMRYVCDREQRSLFDLLLRTANSLAQCITGELADIDIPMALKPCPESPKKGVLNVRSDSVEETAVG